MREKNEDIPIPLHDQHISSLYTIDDDGPMHIYTLLCILC